MLVPFVDSKGKTVCEIEMTSMPAIDMSFTFEKKHYKVTKVEVTGAESPEGEGEEIKHYECTVKEIRKDIL